MDNLSLFYRHFVASKWSSNTRECEKSIEANHKGSETDLLKYKWKTFGSVIEPSFSLLHVTVVRYEFRLYHHDNYVLLPQPASTVDSPLPSSPSALLDTSPTSSCPDTPAKGAALQEEEQPEDLMRWVAR